MMLRFREPLLPLGKAGEWDSGSIYPIPSEAVVNGKTAIYYRGNATGHGGGGKPGYGIAFLSEGGFAGWRAEKKGTLVTNSSIRELGAEDFFLNPDAEGGSIQAELLDTSGTVLPDFSHRDCKPITTKGNELRLSWKGPSRTFQENRSGSAETLPDPCNGLRIPVPAESRRRSQRVNDYAYRKSHLRRKRLA
jgi:hypothetical protein